ncbi:MAG: SRPBCC domain-containing protein [Gaiellaceae bacterium]
MDPSEQDVLRFTRSLAAPPERVFEAWTRPEDLSRWWTGVGGWIGAQAEVDLSPGGRYRISMRDARGALHGVVGVYAEVREPEYLAFTWTWEGEPSVMRGSEGTLVVAEFQAENAGTRLSLAHSGFEGKLVRSLHEEGWNALLANLERTL